MGRNQRKTRLDKVEGGGFIGFGAFAAASSNVSSSDSLGSSQPAPQGLFLSPVYLGSDSQLSVLFTRVDQKRDATTNSKALVELRDFFANPDVAKKVQVDALAHFLYLYHTKLHYNSTPRIRSACLDCCFQAQRRLPKAWNTLVEQQPEILAMLWSGQADPANEVREASKLVVRDWDLSSLFSGGMWQYTRRILSYQKPMAMYEDLFQKFSETGNLSERQLEELDERFERIVGTCLGGMQMLLQQSTSSNETNPVLPEDPDIRFLWKGMLSNKAPLRRKTYLLLSTCCQKVPSLLDRDKLTKLISQNLSSERESTNVKILLDALLAVVALAPPDQRSQTLEPLSKPLIKLFSKGCHGATGWASTVLPIVALSPPASQPEILTSVWQGRSNLVGVADQYQLAEAVAETAAFLLQKKNHDLAQVFASCWLQALRLYLEAPQSRGGPVQKAHQALGVTLAKSLQQLDKVDSSNPDSAMVFIDDWFWQTELPKAVLALDEDTTLSNLQHLLKCLPTSGSTDQPSHLPSLWKCLYHALVDRHQGSSSPMPTEGVYELWLLLHERVPLGQLWDADKCERFLMNDLLRWIVIHTSSVSAGINDDLAKLDFRLFQVTRKVTAEGTWDTFLREILTAKADMEILASGLLILAREGVESVKSGVLDEYCIQVAEDALAVHLGHEVEYPSEDHSDAGSSGVVEFLSTCVGLRSSSQSLVNDSTVSSLVELACAQDQDLDLNIIPVLEVLAALVMKKKLNSTESQLVLIQSWRCGSELWESSVEPWLSSSNNGEVAELVETATKELRSTLRQAFSEFKADSKLSMVWANRAARVLGLCHDLGNSNQVPSPSLELIGMADVAMWTKAQEKTVNFASQSLLSLMELLDKDLRLALFEASSPTDLFVRTLLGLSQASNDIVEAGLTREGCDMASTLVHLVEQERSLVENWTETCINILLEYLQAAVIDDQQVCKGVGVLSQLLALSYLPVCPVPSNAESLDGITAGDTLLYIVDAENPSIKEQCTVVKVHTDLPEEIYFTIRVVRDGVSQERQTVGSRLRLPSTEKGNRSTVALNEISQDEIKARQSLTQKLLDTMILPTWDSWNRPSYELIHVLISRVGLFGARGIGSHHYTVFQKLTALSTQLTGQLEGTASDEMVSTLWKLSLSLGYGINTPSSQHGIALSGVDITGLTRAIVVMCENDEESVSATLKEAVIAWFTIAIPSLQDAELVGQSQNSLFVWIKLLLDELQENGGVYGSMDCVCLRALEATVCNDAANEKLCLQSVLQAFASRWQLPPTESGPLAEQETRLCASVLKKYSRERPDSMGAACRIEADKLSQALLCTEPKRTVAFRLMCSYAKTGLPHKLDEEEIRLDSRPQWAAWAKNLTVEEAEELEEDLEKVTRWIPDPLLEALEAEEWEDVRGAFLIWLSFLQLLESASSHDSLNRPAMMSYMKQCGTVDRILTLAWENGCVGRKRKTLASFEGINSDEAAVSDSVSLESLSAFLFFRTVESFPSMSKNWWELVCPKSSREAVRTFVETHVTPAMLGNELQRIDKSSFGEMSVQGSIVSRQVTANFVQDDFTLSVLIQLPTAFPFRSAEVDCSKTLGVPEARWRRWALQITQMLNHQGGTLKDALLLWKENVEKEFEGVEPCPVCYSVLHVKTHKLPDVECKCCHNRFHLDCLTQWFRSSGKSQCVLCQQPWSGTRV
eukprot:Nitzschia sp. Nitz4//scaffold11_size288233//268075//273153//NITZ4_000823-RA/size288233-processed-gene-0.255-mRNA-1//-1//CDS//3329534221//3382//frame0